VQRAKAKTTALTQRAQRKDAKVAEEGG